MKGFNTLAVLGAVLVAAVPFASADTFTLGTYATGTTDPGYANLAFSYNGFSSTATPSTAASAATYALDPGGVWAPAIGASSWIGYNSLAGPNEPIADNPPTGYYTFTSTFNAVGGTYAGIFDVLADDTAEVIIDGTAVIPLPTLPADSHCDSVQPNCLTYTPTSTLFTLNPGSNTITLVVQQAGIQAYTDPSGVDFTASLSTATPEPNSLVLLGTGLVSSAGMLFRRRRAISL
jgi:hypothetical protein